MELDETTLFNQFIEATNRRRKAFLQHLEDKYVANQDDSDIIDLQSLRVIKNKGHIQRMKDVEFGSMESYSCKSGRRILKILRRRVKIKRKYRLIRDGGEGSSSATEHPSFPSITDCVVKLVSLDVNQITTLMCNNATLKNKTSNRKSKLVDIKSPKSEISFCDLSLRSRRYLSNDNNKLHLFILPKIKKPKFEKSKTGKAHCWNEFEEEMSFTEEIILCDDVNNADNDNFRTEGSHNSLPVIKKTQKYIRLSENEKPHLVMNSEEVDFTKNKAYDNVKNNSKSVCSVFNELNTSDSCLQICPNISSKINEKLASYESDSLSRKSLESSKAICSSSFSFRSRIPHLAVSKTTHVLKPFTKSIFSHSDFH